MCIRDRIGTIIMARVLRQTSAWLRFGGRHARRELFKTLISPCLLYTSPSPRDGHLSIRRQASDVYKRQDWDHNHGKSFAANECVAPIRRSTRKTGVV